MSLKKEAENMKLKDRLDLLTRNIFINTENPVEKLHFDKGKNSSQHATAESNNFWLASVVALLISASIMLNSFFVKSCDPILVNAIKNSTNVFNDQINKPYIVTIGEFSNFNSAKKEAIELLPKLHQVNIKELNNMIYAFEIEKLGSKEKAYSLANEFTKKGFSSVHVRYLKK